MAPKREIDLSRLKGEVIGFWSSANKPTQDLFGLSAQEILLHLKTLYLLTDRVIGAASFFFESEITRQVTHVVRPLAERGELLFFVDAQLDDFVGHGLEKMEKSPRGLTAYENAADVRSRGLYLDAMGYILRRPSASISDAIVDYWVQDLVSRRVGSLGEALRRLVKSDEECVVLAEKLSMLARVRSRDFVWEYIGPKLVALNLPESFRRLTRRRLAQIYSAVTSDLIGATLDQADHGLLGAELSPSSRTDTGLFLECMSILGVRNLVSALAVNELTALKQSPQFILFREFYFKLLEVASYQSAGLAHWLPIYKTAAEQYTKRDVTREEFLSGFRMLCESLGRPGAAFTKPLEILLSTYDLFEVAVIDTFIDVLQAASERSRWGNLVEEYATPVERIIGSEIYERIIRILRHAGRTLETTPATYHSHKEEELRNLLLVSLNSHFMGAAKGEVFRTTGKTDILIEGSARNAFVAECKIWHGGSELLKACDQLLSYLTWRDSMVAMIVFNKYVGEFSQLLIDLPQILVTHPGFLKQVDIDEKGEWRFEFCLPNDSAQIVTVHIFLINIYSRK